MDTGFLKEKIDRKYIFFSLTIACFLGGFALWLFQPAPEEPDLSAAAGGSVGTAHAERAAVMVYISGAVRQPGVYELPPGSRLFDVVKAAGDLLPYADLSAVNLADTIEDGQKITIPMGGSSPTAPAGQQLVNINTAGKTELEALPGIGPATADKIMAWRTEHGQFKSREQIKDVPSIGDGKYEKLKDRITL